MGTDDGSAKRHIGNRYVRIAPPAGSEIGMRCPGAIPNEAGRRAALDRYGLVPGVELPSLQPLVDIAARMFDAPVAAVNMIGSDRVFFAARTGMDQYDMRRDISFCAHVITQDGVMVVEDAELDPRFHDNPLVEQGLIRFYAGVPLVSPSGHALGALCVVDDKPRARFSDDDRARLRDLAGLVLDKLELRRLEAAREASPPRYEAPMRDIDEWRHRREELHRLATHDSLTDLPNSAMLVRRTAAALARGGSCAMVMTGLDGFKPVNARLGRAVGDGILKEVAWRLAARIGIGDVVARADGDVFAILLADCEDPQRLAAFAETIIADVAHPIRIGGHTIRVTASCGLAIAPAHGRTAEELIGSAALALSEAKLSGRGSSCLFGPALRNEAAACRIADAELRRALERGELDLHYQPRFALRDMSPTGAEALIRWRHPARGLVQPTVYLAALDDSALAAELGGWTIATACAQAVEWRKLAPRLRIAVTLFAAHLQAGTLVETIRSALAANGLPGEALQLEIPEHIVLGHERRVLPQLEAVRALGVALVLGDPGAEPASLALLDSCPFSDIAFDMRLVEPVAGSTPEHPGIASLIALSQQRGLGIIARAIESPAEIDALVRQGCTEGQGQQFGKAVPAAVFADKYLADNRTGQSVTA